jgi:hypothetical protein
VIGFVSGNAVPTATRPHLAGGTSDRRQPGIAATAKRLILNRVVDVPRKFVIGFVSGKEDRSALRKADVLVSSGAISVQCKASRRHILRKPLV